MYIGRKPQASKTKYVFFLPPEFRGQNSIAPDTSNNKYELSVRNKESIDNMKILEEEEYTNLQYITYLCSGWNFHILLAFQILGIVDIIFIAR